MISYDDLIHELREIPATMLPAILSEVVQQAEKKKVFIRAGVWVEPTTETHGLIRFVIEVLKYQT
jgi:hypothetical protein